MFAALSAPKPDPILNLMALYRADPRPGKLDLGVGVYRNAEGLTPIFRAVKKAEAALWQSETTKTYTALAGEPAFAAALGRLVLGEGLYAKAPPAYLATPGGTGAVRQAFELLRLAAPGARVWCPAPTWGNHLSILDFMGLPRAAYRYAGADSRALDEAGLWADLEGAKAGDGVLLHGCCHNPTGIDPSPDLWRRLAAFCRDRGLLPIIDLAYLGFGEGIEADAFGTRHIAEVCPEVLIAVSCSKNFGLYRERTGLLLALGGDRAVVQGNLAHLNRQSYSFPPDHGARLVTGILEDAELAADWQDELEAIRQSMGDLRAALAKALQDETQSDAFHYITGQKGMFIRLGLTAEEVARLQSEAGIYMAPDSRINIAGLSAASVPILAKAIAALRR